MCSTIIMFVASILLATLATTLAGYAGSSTNNVGGGNSYGYGYSGSFSGDSGNIPAAPIPDFDFGNFFKGYFDSFQKYHEHFINNKGVYSYALTSATPNANVQAQSSITFTKPKGIQQQIQQHAQLASRGGFEAPAAGGAGGSYGGGFGGSFSGTDGGAAAAAHIGPQGGFQSASVYPENPNAPNVFTRFGGGGGGDGSDGNGGSYSVFTSSVSSNTNGKPFHQASTTVNDNGKVSTYTVKNP